MSIFTDAEASARFVADLLALPTLDQQSAFVRAADLLKPDGLSALLDIAAHLVQSDPGQGRQLARLCADLADRAAAPTAAPRAMYLCAQAHAINAEFDIALSLIDAARTGYAALGEELEALRTNIGLMNVLRELERYQEALAVGQAVLGALDGARTFASPPAPDEISLLAALVHQNQGLCYDQMGQYDQALEAYAAAEACYRELGMTGRLGQISNNRGIVLLSLGHGSDALAAFEAAAAIFTEANLTLLLAQALINIGDAHLLLSNYTASLEAFKQARQLFDSLDALAEQHILLLDTADAYLALNLYPEALAAYREAEALLQAAGMTHHRARALSGIGATLVAQSQFDEAERALSQAAALFAAADNLPLLSSVTLEQAALQAACDKHQAALATARHALALVSGNDWPVQFIYAHIRIADLLLPDLETAERHLQEARRLSESVALPHLRYRLNQRLGHLRLLQGRDREAQALLEAAVDEIERLRGTLAQEVTRTSFLHDKIVAYEGLVQLYLDRGDAESVWQALAIAERAKSRVLIEWLAGASRTQASVAEDSSQATQLQSLQADLNAVYNELLGSAAPSPRRTSLSNLQARAVELEREIGRLRLQVPVTTGALDPLAVPLPFDSIQAQLPPDVVLLAYYIIGAEIVAFVGSGGRLSAVRHLGTAATVQQLVQRLTMQWDRFRVGHEFVSQHMQLLEQSAQRVLEALYAELVAPLEALLAEAADVPPGAAVGLQKLTIVPHGLLHQVPFHALFDGRHYLIERYEIVYAPSVTVWTLCQQRTPRRSNKVVVFGVEDPLIPAVADEARAVARMFRGAELRVDAQATMATFLAEAPGCDILHMACHGLFRADNPLFSALKVYDGWLTAADVMRLDLAGALVTLSACESGRSQVVGGDEIVGLTRAFLGAGAMTVIVSQWLVHDKTTAALMASWYAQICAGGEPAAALRTAQLALKAAYPHPYYWAPFVLVGKR